MFILNFIPSWFFPLVAIIALAIFIISRYIRLPQAQLLHYGSAVYSGSTITVPTQPATVNVNYLGINSSVVSGGANQYWFANNSIHYGGNIGWNFGQVQVSVQDKSFFFFIII